MGPRPDGKTLDRVDNNGNYEPSNCKWSTPQEQSMNVRRHHTGRVPEVITVVGVSWTRKEWARALGMSVETIHKLAASGEIEQSIIKRAVLRLKLEDQQMIDMKRITRGRIPMRPRICWYSADGVGKTTAASGAPKPFFLDFSKGSIKFDVTRVTPVDWDDFIEWLTAIETGKVDCETVVTDSLTELERMMTKRFFGEKGPNSGDQWGFGRGDDYSISKWAELLAQYERIWAMGKTIIFTAHAKVAKFNDPTGPAYDRFQLSMRPVGADIFRQWCDYVCFCREEVLIDDQKQERKKGKTTGVRYQYTRRCPAFDAKARGTSLFPERLLLGWQPLWEAIQADETRAKVMRDEVDAMLAEIADKDLTLKVVEWLRGNPGNVVETHNRVQELLNTKRASAPEAPAVDAQASAQAAS
jgi:hypothetical protein